MRGRLFYLMAVAVALGAGVALAQPEVEWERTYGGSRSEASYSVIKTSDERLALAGYTQSFGENSADFWFVGTDETGDSLWSKVFAGGVVSFCFSAIQTANGGFALAGEMIDTVGLDNVDFWLVVTNSEGERLWERSYGKRDDSEICYSILQTTDGGFALAGATGTYLNVNVAHWLLRTNANGDSLWSRTYDIGIESECRSLIQTTDGGFALVGTSRADFGYDLCLVRTNENGDLLWSRTYGGIETEACYSVIQTIDGGFTLAGVTGSMGAGGYDFWLVSTDDTGDVLWSRTYGGEGNDVCYSHIQTSDGGFVLAGYTTSFGAGNADFWLVRTDENGDSLWSVPFGGEESESCNSLVQMADGGYAVAGSTGSYGSGALDFYLVKTTPDPASVREPQVFAPCTLHLAQPYPNPFNSTVTIPFGFDPINRGATNSTSPINREATGGVRMAIFDPLGRRIAELIPDGSGELIRRYGGNFGKHSVIWDANEMPAGQYIVRLEAGNQQLSQRLSLVK